jgi:hypothetical protein
MQPTMMKSAMQNGLIMGLLFSINFICIALNNQYFSFIFATLILLTTFRLTVCFRDSENEGQITYKKAYNYIVLLFFYASIISCVVKFVYTQFIDTLFLDKLLQIQLSNFKTMNMSLTDSYITMFSKMFKPAAFSLESILENVFRGMLVGLIMAFFIKKDEKVLKN